MITDCLCDSVLVGNERISRLSSLATRVSQRCICQQGNVKTRMGYAIKQLRCCDGRRMRNEEEKRRRVRGEEEGKEGEACS